MLCPAATCSVWIPADLGAVKTGGVAGQPQDRLAGHVGVGIESAEGLASSAATQESGKDAAPATSSGLADRHDQSGLE